MLGLMRTASFGQRGLALATVVLGVGLLSGLAASAAAGPRGWTCAAWAIGLCLVPAGLVFCLEPLYRRPQLAVFVALGGSAVRLLGAAGGALAAVTLQPDLPRVPFISCLVATYLATLAAETLLMQGVSPATPDAVAAAK